MTYGATQYSPSSGNDAMMKIERVVALRELNLNGCSWNVDSVQVDQAMRGGLWGKFAMSLVVGSECGSPEDV